MSSKSSGGSRGVGAPLFLDQTESRRAEKTFFLGDWLPPAYLKVWMTGPPFNSRSGSGTEQPPYSSL